MKNEAVYCWRFEKGFPDPSSPAKKVVPKKKSMQLQYLRSHPTDSYTKPNQHPNVYTNKQTSPWLLAATGVSRRRRPQTSHLISSYLIADISLSVTRNHCHLHNTHARTHTRSRTHTIFTGKREPKTHPIPQPQSRAHTKNNLRLPPRVERLQRLPLYATDDRQIRASRTGRVRATKIKEKTCMCRRTVVRRERRCLNRSNPICPVCSVCRRSCLAQNARYRSLFSFDRPR